MVENTHRGLTRDAMDHAAARVRLGYSPPKGQAFRECRRLDKGPNPIEKLYDSTVMVTTRAQKRQLDEVLQPPERAAKRPAVERREEIKEERKEEVKEEKEEKEEKERDPRA